MKNVHACSTIITTIYRWVSTSTTDHEDCWSTVWAHDGNEQHDSVHVSSITDGYIKEGDIFKVVLEVSYCTWYLWEGGA